LNNPIDNLDADGHCPWRDYLAGPLDGAKTAGKNALLGGVQMLRVATGDQQAAKDMSHGIKKTVGDGIYLAQNAREVIHTIPIGWSELSPRQQSSMVTEFGLGSGIAIFGGRLLGPEAAPETVAGEAAEDVLTIGGRKPINGKYAGGVHPSGVKFTAQGFPDFSPYSIAEVKLKGLTGRYETDSAMANKAMGLPGAPNGYVWHHLQDGETMQLIPTKIHNAVKHTGGAAIVRHGGIDKK
jgi:hypothetical protein